MFEAPHRGQAGVVWLAMFRTRNCEMRPHFAQRYS